MVRHRICAATVIVVVALLAIVVNPRAIPAQTGKPVSRASTSSLVRTATGRRLPPQDLKIMNYYPAREPWNAMWTSYDHSRVDADMRAIAGLGANTVRVIVQPYAVGWPTVSPNGSVEFRDVVDTAARHGLTVMVTLFDGWGTYLEHRLSRLWIHSLLAPYKNDSRLSMVEVQNELPFHRHLAVAWARSMLLYLHALAPAIPRTVSLSGSTPATQVGQIFTSFGRQYLDVIDVHLYGSFDQDYAVLRAAKTAARGRPVIVGEAGVSTGRQDLRPTQEAQASFYEQLRRLCARTRIPPFSPWTLNDLDGGPGEQQSFGLRTLTGRWKLAAGVVRQMFGAAPSTYSATDSNLVNDPNFTDEGAQPNAADSLGAWQLTSRTNLLAAGTEPAGDGRGRVGYLHGAYSDAAGWPALLQQRILAGEQSLDLRADVRLLSATGASTIGLTFYNADGTPVGAVDAPLADDAVTGWQTLTVSARVPRSALTVVVGLKSAGNLGTAEFDRVVLVQGT